MANSQLFDVLIIGSGAAGLSLALRLQRSLSVAVISGMAGAYASAKEAVAKSLAGVAIAVALVPPLSVAGIGVGW